MKKILAKILVILAILITISLSACTLFTQPELTDINFAEGMTYVCQESSCVLTFTGKNHGPGCARDVFGYVRAYTLLSDEPVDYPFELKDSFIPPDYSFSYYVQVPLSVVVFSVEFQSFGNYYPAHC